MQKSGKLTYDGYLRLGCAWRNCRFKRSLFEAMIFSRPKSGRIKAFEVLDCKKGYTSIKDIASKHRATNHPQGLIDFSDWMDTNTIRGYWCTIRVQAPVKNHRSLKTGLYLPTFMLLRCDCQNLLST